MQSFKIIQSITDRQDASLKIFFREVSHIPMITPEREIELAKEIKKGNQSAIDELVKANLRFVISVAKQYQNKGLPLVDLIQSGSEGLIEAATKWDETRGFKFISYAVWWIRQSIIKAISSECRTVRVPTNQIVYVSKINKTLNKLEQELERTPSAEEISSEIELDPQKINIALSAINYSVSLDSPFKNEETDCLLDVIPNKNTEDTYSNLSNQVIVSEINKIISQLPNRESDCVRMFFGLEMNPMTLKEIANRFGIGSERVRQIINGGMCKLKTDYLDDLKLLYNDLRGI